MEYLKVWTSFRELLEPLNESERGRLFTAMLEYAETEETPELKGNERYVWPAAKQSIDNTREKSEQMRSNRIKSEQTKTNDIKTEQIVTKPNSPFDKDKVKDKVNNKSTIVLSANERDRRFDKFWSVYPRHEGKQAAVKAFDKLKPDDTMLETMVNAILKQKRTDQWSDPRYIPHPATWLNGRRWEDEPAKANGGKRVLAQEYEQRDYHEEEMQDILGVRDLFKVGAS